LEHPVTRFDAVVFDMDGVLIDSEPLHFAAANEVLARDGGLSRTENEEFIGTTTEFFWDVLIKRRGLLRARDYYEARYDEAVLRILGQPHAPAPGVHELVDRLRALDVRVAVASSSKRAWIDATLRSIGLPDAFESITSGDEVERGKPDPQIYLLATQRLGLPAQRCLAIEDSPNGILSARRAGMAVLGVRTPYTGHLQLDGATRVVGSLTELDLRADPFGDW
jgi:HAD superfamily hydrolase (TIGR01509 family)